MTRKKILQNISLRSKLIISFAPILLLTIAVIGFFSFQIASKELIEKVGEEQQNLAKKTTLQFDYMAQNAKDFTDYLYISAIADELLSEDLLKMIDSRRTAFRQFSSIMVTHHSFQSMILYKLEESPIPFEPFAINQTGITSAMPYESFKNTEFYTSVMNNKHGVWMYLDKDDKVFVGDNHNKVIFIKVLKNSSTFQDIGILILGIDEAKFRETIDLPLTDEAALYLVGGSGQVFTSTDAAAIGTSFEVLKQDRIDSEQWIISEDVSQKNGWKTVVVQKKDLLLEQINDIRYLTVLIALVCLFFGIITAGFVASTLVKPIGKLLISMRALQKGDFNQKVMFTGRDEIGQLGHGYNVMVQRIKELIDDVYQSKIKQRDAELKTLQAQVNPHFLYNTLNTISWTAEQKGQTELSKIVYSLAQVFRLSLSDGKVQIQLKQEIELIKNYLFIQQTRFHPRFDYELHVDPALAQTRVPKLLIQPLVENAIIHGIEPLGGSGYLQVDVSRNGNRLLIQVTDNGVGIPPGKLSRLQEVMREPSEPVVETADDLQSGERLGWALLNIMERLFIQYGRNAEIRLHSEEGRGTQVTIELPIDKEVEIAS